MTTWRFAVKLGKQQVDQQRPNTLCFRIVDADGQVHDRGVRCRIYACAPFENIRKKSERGRVVSAPLQYCSLDSSRSPMKAAREAAALVENQWILSSTDDYQCDYRPVRFRSRASATTRFSELRICDTSGSADGRHKPMNYLMVQEGGIYTIRGFRGTLQSVCLHVTNLRGFRRIAMQVEAAAASIGHLPPLTGCENFMQPFSPFAEEVFAEESKAFERVRAIFELHLIYYQYRFCLGLQADDFYRDLTDALGDVEAAQVLDSLSDESPKEVRRTEPDDYQVTVLIG